MISVIIPAYNAEKTIGKCIEALLKQSYKKPYEIVIVDDGSVDRTKDIVKKYGGKFGKGKLKLIEQKHKGPAAARNLGAKRAKGSIILFTDSDCTADKNWISEMINPFKRNRKIAGVQGRYKTEQKSLTARFAQAEIEERYMRMIERGVDSIGTYAAAYRKGIFLKMGGFDRRFPIASGEDFDLSYRIKDKGFLLTFNPNAVVYHQHPDSLFKYLKQKFWRSYWRVFLYRKHPKKIKTESYTPQTLKLQISLFYAFMLLLILSVYWTSFVIYSLIFFVLLVISTLPFACRVFRKDKAVGFSSPVFLILRTVVFSFGLLYGLVKLR